MRAGDRGIGRDREDDPLVVGFAIRRGSCYRVLSACPAENEVKHSYSALTDLVGGVFEETRSSLPRPQEQALAVALLRAETDELADPRTTAAGVVGVMATRGRAPHCWWPSTMCSGSTRRCWTHSSLRHDVCPTRQESSSRDALTRGTSRHPVSVKGCRAFARNSFFSALSRWPLCIISFLIASECRCRDRYLRISPRSLGAIPTLPSRSPGRCETSRRVGPSTIPCRCRWGCTTSSRLDSGRCRRTHGRRSWLLQHFAIRGPRWSPRRSGRRSRRGQRWSRPRRRTCSRLSAEGSASPIRCSHPSSTALPPPSDADSCTADAAVPLALTEQPY